MKKEYIKNNVAKKGDKKLNVQELDNVAGGCDPDAMNRINQIAEWNTRDGCELFEIVEDPAYGKNNRFCGNCKHKTCINWDGIPSCEYGR